MGEQLKSHRGWHWRWSRTPSAQIKKPSRSDPCPSPEKSVSSQKRRDLIHAWAETNISFILFLKRLFSRRFSRKVPDSYSMYFFIRVRSLFFGHLFNLKYGCPKHTGNARILSKTKPMPRTSKTY